MILIALSHFFAGHTQGLDVRRLPPPSQATYTGGQLDTSKTFYVYRWQERKETTKEEMLSGISKVEASILRMLERSEKAKISVY